MRRINLPLILDTLFAALCAFLLFFTSIRYYTKSAFVALGFAIVACLLFGSLSFLYISKKQNKHFLISKNDKQKKLLSLHLSLSTDEYVLDLFSRCLSDEEKAKRAGSKILKNECAYFFNFKMQAINEDDVAKVIKDKSEQKKIIFCNRISAEAMLLCENFAIEVKQIDYVYNLLKESELLPEKYIYEEQQKTNFFKRIKIRFNRKICAPLFWSGLALLALSYFTFFPIYYIVTGSLMLIISAVALVVN